MKTSRPILLLLLLVPAALGTLAGLALDQFPALFTFEKKLVFPPSGKSALSEFSADHSQLTTWQQNAQRQRRLDTLQTGLDPDRLFQKNPPSAPDWLVILDHARQRGYRQITITSPLSWENADPLELGALDHLLSEIPRCVLAIDLRRESQTSPLPPYLRRSAIPLSTFKGNPALLPVVNRVPFAPSATGPGVTYFGFRQIETSPALVNDKKISAPLLARWGAHLLPSLELAHLMAAARCAPDELDIRPGQYLRLGKIGPLIPIDQFCRLTYPVPAGKKEARPATELLDKTPAKPAAVRLLLSAQDDPPHLQFLARELPALAARTLENPRLFKRLLPWQNFLLFLALPLILLPFRHRLLRIIPALIILGLPTFILHSGHWLPQVPLAVCLFTCILLPAGKNQDREKSRKKNPKAKRTLPKKAATKKPPGKNLPKKNSKPKKRTL